MKFRAATDSMAGLVDLAAGLVGRINHAEWFGYGPRSAMIVDFEFHENKPRDVRVIITVERVGDPPRVNGVELWTEADFTCITDRLGGLVPA